MHYQFIFYSQFATAPGALQNNHSCSTWVARYFYCELLNFVAGLNQNHQSILWPLAALIHPHCTPSSYLGNLLCAHWSWSLRPCHPLYCAAVTCLIGPQGPLKANWGEREWWWSTEPSLQKASLKAKRTSKMSIHLSICWWSASTALRLQ